MYLKFFDLSKKPFQLTPDPYYLYLSQSHKEAIASLAYAISERKGFMALFGEVGTGKTTVVRTYLARANRKVVKPIYVFDPNVRFQDLIKIILLELGEEPTKGSDLELNRQLSRVLIDQHQKGAIVVLIIDESHLMPVETLEKLRLLSNLETAENKLLQLVMVGPPEFEERIKLPELRQLNQRFAVRSRLQLFQPEDSMLYISHRISRAGGTPETIFTREAIEAIVESAGGSPRILNILCDNALVNAFAYEERPVSLRVAQEVIADYWGDRTSLDPADPQRKKTFHIPPAASLGGPVPEASGRNAATTDDIFMSPHQAPFLFGATREQEDQAPKRTRDRNPVVKTWLQRIFTTEEPNGTRRVSPLRLLGVVGVCLVIFMILNGGETRSATTNSQVPASLVLPSQVQPETRTAFSYPEPKNYPEAVSYRETRTQSVRPYQPMDVKNGAPTAVSTPYDNPSPNGADSSYGLSDQAPDSGYSAPVNAFMGSLNSGYFAAATPPSMTIGGGLATPVGQDIVSSPAVGETAVKSAEESAENHIANFPVVRVVRRGDSLSELCDQVYGTSKPWILKRVLDYNPDISSTNEIKVGFKIYFPEPGEPPQL